MVGKVDRTVTIQEFRKAVLILLEQYSKYTGSLEEYLRALLHSLYEAQSLQPSYDLFLDVLAAAFHCVPSDFDYDRSLYDRPIHWYLDTDEYVVTKLVSAQNDVKNVNVSLSSDFQIVEYTLLFQIADLCSMRDQQCKNPYRYFGVQSMTGNSWYNFDVETYLECGTAGLEAHYGISESSGDESVVDWSLFAELLELGRLYE